MLEMGKWFDIGNTVLMVGGICVIAHVRVHVLLEGCSGCGFQGGEGIDSMHGCAARCCWDWSCVMWLMVKLFVKTEGNSTTHTRKNGGVCNE